MCPEMLLPSCLAHFIVMSGDLFNQSLASLAEKRLYYAFSNCEFQRVLHFQGVKSSCVYFPNTINHIMANHYCFYCIYFENVLQFVGREVVYKRFTNRNAIHITVSCGNSRI